MEEVEPCHKRCINPAWSAAAGEAERRGSWCPGMCGSGHGEIMINDHWIPSDRNSDYPIVI